MVDNIINFTTKYNPRDFSLYINNNKIDWIYDNKYKKWNAKICTENSKINVKCEQAHICDSKHWLINGLIDFTFGFITGIGPYSNNEERRGPTKAILEGTFNVQGNLEVEIDMVKIKSQILKDYRLFRFNLNGSKDCFIEERNEIISPDYLKYRWKIIRIPVWIMLILIVIFILFICYRILN